MPEQPARVLLIDDDEDDFVLTRDLIAEINDGLYALDWVSDYDSGLQAMCRQEHVVYLLDYRLGPRTGVELLREVTRRDCLGPTIFLTGQGEREIDLEAMQAGASDYLEKGTLSATLLERSIRYSQVHWKYQSELEERVAERTADLVRAEERLRDADRRKDEFLAMLAHELRNPLAPIRTGLEVLNLAADDPQTAEIRSMMERQVQHMTRLIDDLLDVSRITRGKLALHKSRVDLAEVIQNAVEATRPFISEEGHRLDVTLSAERIELEADPVRMAQVFSNLLHNAAKYTPRGGAIRLEVGTQGDTVEVSVTDTGIGIPAEMQERIFDMFSQVGRLSETGYTGLGIGLTLVKALVRMHGGAVSVQSAGAGKGSRFSVRLPIAAQAGSSAPAQEAGGVAEPAREVQHRVLVVDDNEDSARTMGMMLELMGNRVQLAYDGRQAVELGRQFRPEVILMDLGMPRLDGYEAARAIRDEDWGKSVILVAMTGWGQDTDRQRAQDAGFDQHLIKPLDPENVRELLSELNDGSAVER